MEQPPTEPLYDGNDNGDDDDCDGGGDGAGAGDGDGDRGEAAVGGATPRRNCWRRLATPTSLRALEAWGGKRGTSVDIAVVCN